MIKKGEKLKVIIQWYDIMLQKGIINKSLYKKLMFTIPNSHMSVINDWYKLSIEKLEENSDWIV